MKFVGRCQNLPGETNDQEYAKKTSKDDEGGLVYKVMTSTLFRNVTLDHKDADNEMARSGLDWTILRPPRLLNGPAKGRLRVASGHLAEGMTITRADVADFMLEEAATPRYVHQFVGLSN